MRAIESSDTGPGYRVAIAGGGSAGHVTAALAIGDAFEDALGCGSVVYVGTGDGFEGRLVPRAGKPLEFVRGSPMMREGPLGKVRAVLNLAAGWTDARRLLAALDVGMVVGCGGYASAGTLLAARSLGLPSALHEANAMPGRANRLTGRVVDKVYLGWEAARPWFRSAPARVTGNPVRVGVGKRGPKPVRRANAGAACHLLILGGSVGSAFLNRRVPGLMSTLAETNPGLTVTHQSGDKEISEVRKAYADLGVVAQVEGYIDDIAAAYDRADFAISCGGAMTLAEIAAVGLPALIVPLSAASDDHQTWNARAFAAVTSTPWVAEADWNQAALARRVGRVLSDRRAYDQASAALAAACPPSPARTIVADFLAGAAAAPATAAAPSRP